MKAVLQRVAGARVEVAGAVVAEIGDGLLILLGVHREDGHDQARWLANKCAGLRIFSDADGAMNNSIQQSGGEMLVVSQFTLYGDCRKGRRPSFVAAAHGERAEELYREFCRHLAATGVRVAEGVFGAHMRVELINDGPVTLIVETPA